MDDQELPILTPVTFVHDGEQKKVQITRFKDGSACIQGDKLATIYEGNVTAWKSALRYLKSHGYKRFEILPPSIP